MKKLEFNNKLIWITGASSGIGAALATQWNVQGARVIASARRKEKLIKLKHDCLYPENLLVVPMDITDPDSITKAVAEVNKLGSLFLVVHNAGISQKGLVIENDVEIDRVIMETNYFGTVALTKAIMPIFMRQGSGWFAVMSSFAGVMGLPARSSYAASKHALHGFFDSLKAEEMGCEVKVSYIIPGFINTEITAKGLRSDGNPNGEVETSHILGMNTSNCANNIIKGLSKKKATIPIGKIEVNLLKINRVSPRLANYIVKNHPMRKLRMLKSSFNFKHLIKPKHVIEQAQ